MKKYFGVFLVAFLGLLLFTNTSASQAKTGIVFSKIRFDAALKKSNKTGKLIFIDAYTDWCGPCKKMAATTFRDKEIGEVFNENFINMKVEMEKEEDGEEIAARYRVRAYPTLLIIDGDGKLIKQVIGFQTKDRLMALAESVL